MTDTETTSTPTGPGLLRRLLAAVSRGLRAIFRPAVIVSLSAVVAAAALVVIAIEQREQAEWQRSQTCLAWFQIEATSDQTQQLATVSGGGRGRQEFSDDLANYLYLRRAVAAETCGGNASEDDLDAPGADTSAEVERQVEHLLDAYEEEFEENDG